VDDHSDQHLSADSDTDVSSLRSPVRPTVPAKEETTTPMDLNQVAPDPSSSTAEKLPRDPKAALDDLRIRMEQSAAEFADGKLNHAQFTAIYKHYSDKRTIIERLTERNPENQAWKQVAQSGHTPFLRSHFEARPLYYVVYPHTNPTPLMTAGKATEAMTNQIDRLVQVIGKVKNRSAAGLARKAMGDGQWLLMALGAQAITLVVYTLQPSAAQTHLVRDLHADFERANQRLLERGVTSPERLVFPQRALIPGM
jgi:hypothetical protein